MSDVILVGGLDVAELVFYAFFLFFLGLVIYLRREDRREGYPLEEDVGGRLLPNDGLLQRAPPKTFRLPHGLGMRSPEANSRREPVTVPNSQREAWPGSPLWPVGDPMSAGIGPGAYVQRPDRPDLDMHGNPRIVPLRDCAGFYIAPREPDIEGWPMAGCDGVIAGRVSDIWVDSADHLIRYLSVSLSGGDSGRVVLVPFAMCTVHRSRRFVACDAAAAAQFAGAPTPSTPGRITLLEEDKILGYFGAGYLYATPERSEPLL